MMEQFRALVLGALEERSRASVEAVANLSYSPSARTADGQAIPGTSLEDIAVQTIALNARTRALHEAAMLVQQAYKQLVSPEKTPEGNQQKKEAPYG